jgi:hypothetical protein
VSGEGIGGKGANEDRMNEWKRVWVRKGREVKDFSILFRLGSEEGTRVGGTRGGLGMGKERVAGDVAYLLCAASLHDADRMADERRCCQRRGGE